MANEKKKDCLRPTVKKCKAAIREGMSGENALHYVPVQKMTIAISLSVIAERCKHCCSKDCSDCEVSSAFTALTEAICLPSMFDEDFKLLPAPNGDEK